MTSRSHVMSAALIATGLLATTAFAGESQKEVSFTAKGAIAGKFVQGVPIGKITDNIPEAFVGLYDESGSWTGGPHPGTRRCVGDFTVVKGMAESHDVCIDTDADGDVIVWKMTPEARSMAVPTMKGTGEAVWGTGKYAGVTGASTFTCESSGNPSGYTNECESQVTYKFR